MKFRVFLVLVFAAGISTAALAQVRQGTVEISPFAGYLFGGEFSRGSNDLFDFRVEADDDVTYGIRLGFNLTDNFEMEFQASRTESAFVSDDDVLFGGNGNSFGDLTISATATPSPTSRSERASRTSTPTSRAPPHRAIPVSPEASAPA